MSEKMNYETPGQLAMRETLDTLYGMGHDFYKTYEERIKKVTREDVIKTAEKYLKNSFIAVTMPDDRPNSTKSKK
jgi:predicted Zn-dependent peptidase